MSIKELTALAQELEILKALLERTNQPRSRLALQARAWQLLGRASRGGQGNEK